MGDDMLAQMQLLIALGPMQQQCADFMARTRYPTFRSLIRRLRDLIGCENAAVYTPAVHRECATLYRSGMDPEMCRKVGKEADRDGGTRLLRVVYLALSECTALRGFPDLALSAQACLAACFHGIGAFRLPELEEGAVGVK
jgi:hypothetical protein